MPAPTIFNLATGQRALAEQLVDRPTHHGQGARVAPKDPGVPAPTGHYGPGTK